MQKLQINWNVCDELLHKGLTAESDYVRELHEELHRTRKINTALSEGFSELEAELGRQKGFIQGVVNDLIRET